MGSCCNPDPTHYSSALAFSPILYPPPHRHRLAAGLPQGEDDGLTTFHGRITDGLGSACSPVARQRRPGEGGAPSPRPLTFWFKPVSAFGLLVLTTFIGSSLELALPSTLAPDRRDAGSRRDSLTGAPATQLGEDTLSQELRTVGLLRPHVLVGYQWPHTGLCPGYKASHNRYIRSIVSQPLPNRTGTFSCIRLSRHRIYVCRSASA